MDSFISKSVRRGLLFSLIAFGATLLYLRPRLVPSHTPLPTFSCVDSSSRSLWQDGFWKFSLIKQRPFLEKLAPLNIKASIFFKSPKLKTIVKNNSLNIEEIKSLQRYEISLELANEIKQYVKFKGPLSKKEKLSRIDCMLTSITPFFKVMENERTDPRYPLSTDIRDYLIINHSPHAPKVDYHKNSVIVFLVKKELLQWQQQQLGSPTPIENRPPPRLVSSLLPLLPYVNTR